MTKPRLFLLILAVTCAVYGNTFFNDWTFDDYPIVVENTDSHSIAGFLENTYPGRPLRELTHIPEYQLFGTEPAGYRIQQLLWHAANGFLLVLLFQALGVERRFALWGVLLFLVHPLQVESVASIAHRKELLPLFFSVVSLLCYIKAVSARGGRRLWLLGGAALAFVVAFFANVTAVSFPLVFILYDFIFLKKDDRILLKRPLWLAAGVAAAGAFVVYHFREVFTSQQLGIIYSQNNFPSTKSYLPLWLADLQAFAIYIWKIVVPINLAPEYVLAFSASLLQWQAWIGLALLTGAGIVLFRTRKSFPPVAFGIGWFLILYFPVSNVIPSGYIMADRYMYLCLPGVAIILAALLQRWPGWQPKVVLSIVILVFSVLSVVQNTCWRNNRTLWQHAVDVNPMSTGAQWSLGQSLMAEGEWTRAKEPVKRVLELNRFFLSAYLSLGKIEEKLGNYDEAMKNYDFFVRYAGAAYPREAAEAERRLLMLKFRGGQ